MQCNWIDRVLLVILALSIGVIATESGARGECDSKCRKRKFHFVDKAVSVKCYEWLYVDCFYCTVFGAKSLCVVSAADQNTGADCTGSKLFDQEERALTDCQLKCTLNTGGSAEAFHEDPKGDYTAAGDSFYCPASK